MPELNLKQITDRLNAEFTGDSRKLVFWYDDNGDFSADIDSMQLENAKVYKLEKDNQFYTKYFLEREDTETNYLIYAPFSKPDVKDNHLEDMLLYSKRFYADRASLLTVDLGIEEKYKPVIQKYIKFFASKERTQAFYDLEIENFNEANIITGLLSALCKTHTCSFEEVVRVVLTESDLEENKYLQDFAKYDLGKSFWKLCEQHFGYLDENPTLEKLVVTMFVTYANKYLGGSLPESWKTYVSYKAGNIIAFLDSLMNSVLYRGRFDELSSFVETGLNAPSVFDSMPPEELVHCDVFQSVDVAIIKWLQSRLLAEDTGAQLSGNPIPDICRKRSRMHFGEKLADTYALLESAYYLISSVNYQPAGDFAGLIQQYQETDYRIDREYRQFYYHLDQVSSPEHFEEIRILVENIYANEYLAEQLPRWNEEIQQAKRNTIIPPQTGFYSKFVKNLKERTMVIISDAMRYEVGQELFRKMQDDPKCMPESKLSVVLSTLPSYTKLGMAALLPHNELQFTENYDVLIDGQSTQGTEARDAILKNADKDGICITYEDLLAKKGKEFQSFFAGKHVVYVYHNQIDAIGDKQLTENQVFDACEKAVKDIAELIQRTAGNGNTYHFIVTSDHGFLYRRNPLEEGDKISGVSDKGSEKHRRFVLSESPVSADGVVSFQIKDFIGGEDDWYVSVPVGPLVFKASGGMNYVHGGSSPQEMLVPVLDIKMDRGKQETKSAEITLVSVIQKITNSVTPMEFIQTEPVSDTVKPAKYKLYFVSEDGEKISNENILIADSRDPDPGKRRYRQRFTFKNKKYDNGKQYYLVVMDITDENFAKEAFRHPVIMDMMFSDDFGF